MENYINFIAQFFQGDLFLRHKELIQSALQEYFGIKEHATVELAIERLRASFNVGGSAKNEFTILPNEDGSFRVKHHFEYDIRAEYLALIPILAMRLGYQ